MKRSKYKCVCCEEIKDYDDGETHWVELKSNYIHLPCCSKECYENFKNIKECTEYHNNRRT